MKMMSKVVTLILLPLFFIGLCILLYPAISQYWNSVTQSKMLVKYEQNKKNISEEDYSLLFEGAYEYNKALSELEYPLKEYDSVSGYSEVLNLSGTGMMGYITIDKIRVELPIYHGVGVDVLNVACGHLPGTSIPVGGKGTHAVLSAHRGLPTAKLFTNLDKLETGDTFTITILDIILTYQVDQISIVRPNDTSKLNISDGEDYVTLLTCTPYGINSHRLLVRGKRIETNVVRNYYITSEAYIIDKLIVSPLVALPIILALIIYVLIKPVKPKVYSEEELL